MSRNDDEPVAPAAEGRGGRLAALRQLVKFEDRRIQASAFFLAWGSSAVIHGTVPNREAHPDQVLSGFAMCTVGAALMFLTLSGAGGLGRTAARIEEALRGFFC